MTNFSALILKQGKGPGVSACQNLLLCFHFTHAETQQQILTGQYTWTFALF